MISNQITGRRWRALAAAARGVARAALCASLALALAAAPVPFSAGDAAAQARGPTAQAPYVHKLTIEGASRIGRVALELNAPTPTPLVRLGPTARSLIIETVPLNWRLPTQGRPENEPMVNQFRLRQNARGAALILDLAVDVVNAFPAVHASSSGRYVVEVYFVTDAAQVEGDQTAPPAFSAAAAPQNPLPPRLRSSVARSPGGPQQSQAAAPRPNDRLRALENDFLSGQRMPDDMYFLGARRNAAAALEAANAARQGQTAPQPPQIPQAPVRAAPPRNQLSAAPPRPNPPQNAARRPDGLQFSYSEIPHSAPDRLALEQAILGRVTPAGAPPAPPAAPPSATDLAASAAALNAAVDQVASGPAEGVATASLLGPLPPRLRPARRPEAPAASVQSVQAQVQTILAGPQRLAPPLDRAAPRQPAAPSHTRQGIRVAAAPLARPAPVNDPVRIDFEVMNRFFREAQPPMIESAPPPPPPKRLIVIDPGHGVHDPGAVAGPNRDIYEKNIVLTYSLELRDALEATGRYRVMLTRDDDTFLSLGERVEFARERDALLFVSIHADSLPETDARGLAVYTLSDSAAENEIRMIARGERDVGAVGGVNLQQHPPEVRSLVVDITQRETLIRSEAFARILTNKLSGVTALLPRSRRLAGFRVLKAPDTPSVLVELGFLTNEEDLAQLQSEEWRATTIPYFVNAIDLWSEATEARRLDVR